MDKKVPETECAAIRSVLGRVGDRWSLLVINELAEGPRRSNDLRRGLSGISQRMLTRTVRILERDGLVERTVFDTVPPGVEYALTPFGRTLIEPVRRLAEWAKVHQDQIHEAHRRFDGEPGSESG